MLQGLLSPVQPSQQHAERRLLFMALGSQDPSSEKGCRPLALSLAQQLGAARARFWLLEGEEKHSALELSPQRRVLLSARRELFLR